MEQQLRVIVANLEALQKRCDALETQNSTLKNRCFDLELRCAVLEADKFIRNGSTSLRELPALQSRPRTNYGASASTSTSARVQQVSQQRTERQEHNLGDEQTPQSDRNVKKLGSKSPYVDWAANTMLLPVHRNEIVLKSKGMGFAIISVNQSWIFKGKVDMIIFMDEQSANDYYDNECDTDEELVLKRICPLTNFNWNILESCIESKGKSADCLLWKTYAQEFDGKAKVSDIVAIGAFCDNDHDFFRYQFDEINFWKGRSGGHHESTCSLLNCDDFEVYLEKDGQAVAGVYSGSCTLHKSYRSWLHANGNRS